MNADGDYQRLLARLTKLLNLAERGVGGEADNAARMLEKLLAKHGLSVEQIRAPEQQRAQYEFRHRGGTDRLLFFQIIFMVRNDQAVNFKTYKRRKNVVLVDLTPAEHAEVVMTYATLSPALRKHLEIATHAFLLKNQVHSNKPIEPSPDAKPRDPQATSALASMIAATKKTHVRAGITDQSGQPNS